MYGFLLIMKKSRGKPCTRPLLPPSDLKQTHISVLIGECSGNCEVETQPPSGPDGPAESQALKRDGGTNRERRLMPSVAPMKRIRYI